MEECAAVACPDAGDECDTPSDWTPPAPAACEGSALPIGTGALADCSFDSGLAFDPEGTVLQLESADQSLCARVERRNDGPGMLANIQWTLIDLRIGPLGSVTHIDSDVCMYASHHNFADWAHAWSVERRFDLLLTEDGHGGPRSYRLYVYEQGPVDPNACAANTDGSGCIAGPIELLPFNP